MALMFWISWRRLQKAVGKEDCVEPYQELKPRAIGLHCRLRAVLCSWRVRGVRFGAFCFSSVLS
jgi:hypothetical protein